MTDHNTLPVTQELKPCPFCGQQPVVEPWHGGAPTKVMINCPGLWPSETVAHCEVSPQVTGETPEEAAANWNTRATPALSVDREVIKRIFLAAHSDGWTGNQCRRDAQHVDAKKSWEFYVSNGALAKALSLPASPASQGDEERAREVVGEPETRRVSPLMVQYLSPGQAFCDHGSSYICVEVGEELATGQFEVKCHSIIAYRNALRSLAFRTSPVGSDDVREALESFVQLARVGSGDGKPVSRSRRVNAPASVYHAAVAALTPVSPLCLKGVDDAK